MPKPKISFTDLGLTTPEPSTLRKTAAEKHHERLTAKKDKNERVKSALATLSETREQVEKHKRFVDEEQQKEAREKMLRKQALKAEHVKAQNQRNAESVRRDKELVVQQTVVSDVVKKTVAAEEEKLRLLQKLIDDEDAARMKTAVPAIHVAVKRDDSIQESRSTLPVLREEQSIVEAINDDANSCVLICGETGSGKTTQIPQFLWECGYGHPCGAPLGREGMIVVTEPRRVAAIAMAKRVAEELGERFGDKVCYQVRYDNNLSDKCQLKFVTEGVLIRELQNDFLLTRYSAVIVDEAHERSVSGDLLMGMLSRIVPLRRAMHEEGQTVNGKRVTPLRMVIMSATLRVADFRDNRILFAREPPMINVEARRFPVTNHFAKRTEMRDYCSEAFRKVTQIHKKLPPGGILVFLSTQREIDSMCDRLRRHYRKTRIAYDETSYRKQSLLPGSKAHSEKDAFGLADEQYALQGDAGHSPISDTLADFGLRDDFVYESEDESPPVEVQQSDEVKSDSEEDTHADDEEMQLEAADEENEADGQFDSLHVLPLYALLNSQEQQRVFAEPVKGKRLCVVATNVAETSITIPGIRYVVDCGRVKNKKLDSSSGASAFFIEWTSQASAEQRSGRAGRTGPGHCYRLYSTAVFTNQMPKHSTPEILRTPAESLVLLMKSVGIDRVTNFPFPTSPSESDLDIGLRHLVVLGALDRSRLKVTAEGRRLQYFPVAPRYAKMISTAVKTGDHSLIDMVVSLVAVAATSLDVFEQGAIVGCSRQDQEADFQLLHKLMHSGSDLITFLRALGKFVVRPTIMTCQRFHMVHKTMNEACQLRRQLLACVSSLKKDEDAESFLLHEDNDLSEDNSRRLFDASGDFGLTKESEIVLRKIIGTGLIDQVARRASVQECRSRGVTFTDGKTSKLPYLDVKSGSVVYVHPSSTVAKTHPPPEFLIYCGLVRAQRGEHKDDRTFMKGVTIVTKQWLDDLDFDEEALVALYHRPLIESV